MGLDTKDNILIAGSQLVLSLGEHLAYQQKLFFYFLSLFLSFGFFFFYSSFFSTTRQRASIECENEREVREKKKGTISSFSRPHPLALEVNKSPCT